MSLAADPVGKSRIVASVVSIRRAETLDSGAKQCAESQTFAVLAPFCAGSDRESLYRNPS